MLPDSTLMNRLLTPALAKAAPFSEPGKSAMAADIEFARHHFVRERSAAGEVAPLDVIGGVLVPAIVGQEPLKELQLTDQQTPGHTVDGRVLCSNGDTDRLGERSRSRRASGERQQNSGWVSRRSSRLGRSGPLCSWV